MSAMIELNESPPLLPHQIQAVTGDACAPVNNLTLAYLTYLRTHLCSGPSMEPTLYTNDAILTEHLSPRFNKISKGDIVVARSPTNPKQFICKRVTGVEGDKMCPGFISQVVVPRGHVWLEGDNRSNSSDSRAYGPVPIGLLRGRVLCVIWPFSHATLLTQPNT